MSLLARVGMTGKLFGRLGLRARLSLPLAVVVLAVCGALLFMHTMHLGTGGRWIMPVDDAYIHQQYAKQLARGRVFQYNDGDVPSSGATSLLYPLILAGAWWVGFRGDLLSAFAFAFGAACFALSALLILSTTQRIYALLSSGRRPVSPAWVGLTAALLFLTNGALLWGFLSGMETGLFIVLALAALNAVVEKRRRSYAVFGALLALTRPEGAVLGAVVALLAAVRAGRVSEKSKCCWLLNLPPLCGLVHPAVNLALTGNPVASAARTKSWLANVPFVPRDILFNLLDTAREIWVPLLTGLAPASLRRLPNALLRSPSQLVLYLPPFLGALGLGYSVFVAIRRWKDERGMVGAVLSLWVALGLMFSVPMRTATWQYYRYQLAYFTLGLLSGAPAVAVAVGRLGNARRQKSGFLLLGSLMVLLSASTIPGFLARYGSATRTTLQQQVRLGEWIAANLPADTRVGVYDAGAIRYYGERPTYDMVGLTGPIETSLAWMQGSGSIYEAMERSPERPAAFAVYDDVHESPYFVHTDLFKRELFRAQTDGVAEIAYSDHQVVFEPDWHLCDSGASVYQTSVLQDVRSMTLVDWVDVADLASEGAHGYRWWNELHKGSFPTEVFQLTYYLPPSQEVMDGGRLITGGEAFDFSTIAGQDALLVGRFLGQSAVHLQVKVNGRLLGPWGYAPLPGRWQEQVLKIPGAYITGKKTRVEIDVDSTRPDLEFHRPFYYWCYQGSLTEEVPHIAQPLNAQVGQGIALLGYSLVETKTDSAYQLDLDLYWQATRAIEGDYKVFVHWSDERETIFAQHDGRPGYDLRPTWVWRPGETIVDHHTLTLPLSAQPPAHTILYVGMYDAQKGDRLPIAGGDAANRLELKRIALPSSGG